MTPTERATPEDPRAAIVQEYGRRLTARQAALDRHERGHVWLSRLRLGIVGLVIVGGVVWGAAHVWAYGLLGAVFVAAAVVHSRVLTQRARQRRAVAYFERGLARLNHRWMGHGDDGERYRPSGHLYAEDLDLFGPGSLFELIGTAQTEPGQDTLAAWLLEPAPPAQVRARQAAVRELVPRLDLREALALDGDAAAADRLSRLREWAAEGRRVPMMAQVAVLATSLLLVALAAWMLVTWTVTPPVARAVLLVAAIQAGLALWLHGRIHDVLRAMSVPIGQLALLSGVLNTIEREPFAAPRLVAISAALGGTQRKASAEIARLEQLVALLESRKNLIVVIPAAALAAATQIGGLIDAWRGRVGPHVVRWIDAVGEFEALCAMATYAAERPEQVFPEFVPPPATLTAEGVAHPLLPAEAVGNDLALGGTAPHLLIVSGSNMSGKSTFLRALGANVVLAQMGLPVRATTFRLSPLAVGASIRVLDSLQEGHSRFFAEIRRLAQIVALAKDRPNAVLFLLDEILAGTNSHDRLRGAEGVVAGLLGLDAIGLITTHDLALGEVAARMPADAVNVHFADEFDAGGLHFDFRLRPGLVRTSNALALMRAVGLEIGD